MTRGALPILLLGLLTACGSAPGDAAWQERSQPIVLGDPAPADDAAVALVARRVRCNEPQPMLLCSGALVGPDLVLTAAHCLDVFGEDGQYEVFFGERLLPISDGDFVRVSEAWRHPAYDPETHAFDVALFRLAFPVEVRPYALSARPPAVDAIARTVGFGETRDEAAPAGRRLQGTTRITELLPAAFHAAPAPAMSCTGDSGGPVLVEIGGEEFLAGITASGDIACRRDAFAVRVDVLLADFLEPALAAPPTAAAGPQLPLAALCTAACEDAADCPAGLACVPDRGDTGRCLLLALQEGAYGVTCAEDDGCAAGSLCARLEPAGEDACRCFTSCTRTPPPIERDATDFAPGGCTSARGAALWGLISLLPLGRRRANGRRAS